MARLTEQVIGDALAQYGEAFTRELQAATPVDTGFMRRSWTAGARRARRRRGGRRGAYYSIGNTAPYAGYVLRRARSAGRLRRLLQ